MGGWHMKQVVQWVNLKELSKLLKPWVLRRLKKDCLDLPDKLFTTREVALESATWARYQELKKEAVMALPTGDQLLEPNAAVRVMRLCQITSGHIGGTTVIGPDTGTVFEHQQNAFTPTDLSSEKLDWCIKYLTEECQARYVIVWCRWRRERERLAMMLAPFEQKAVVDIHQLYGGQQQKEREFCVGIFSQITERKPRQVLLAQPHAGGHGLNLIAATEVIYLSNDWSLGIRLQSEDRCHRPGQKHPVTYIDVIAVGPKGQRTIDWTVYQALIKKQELAHLTASAWRQKLEEDNW
jgi:SNF2 family DNA or RNA helicase